jgi:hypothetical protein
MMQLSLHGKLFLIEIKTIFLLAGGTERLMVDVACQLTAHGQFKFSHLTMTKPGALRRMYLVRSKC